MEKMAPKPFYVKLILMTLIGSLTHGVIGASTKTRPQLTWAYINADAELKSSAPNPITSTIYEDWTDGQTLEVNEGLGTNETTEWEVLFPLETALTHEESEKHKVARKTKRSNNSITHPLPIELESFVGDGINEKLFTTSSEKLAFQDWLQEMKREARKVELLMKAEKRNQHSTHDHAQQQHLWSCETTMGWRNLGKDHYPQFIRTATCSSPNCFSDLYRCVPKHFTLKVLKKLDRDEVVDNAAAVQLPEALRNSVKFINVTTNICCECAL